ncbi:hypothetical protein ABVT39_021169 [Epinephelus coioides]
MAQFIHLLLLLGMCHVAATYVLERQVWLLEGSSATFPFPPVLEGRTIKYCGRGGNKCECDSKTCTSNNASLPGVTLTDRNLTITNFTRKNDGINLCYDSSEENQCVHLNVSIGLRFYQTHKSWIDALQHCHNKNSALVQITNQTVQDAVNSFLQNKSGLDGGVWIGLERSIFGVNVPWQWISGERVKEIHWSSSTFVDPLNNHCGKVIQVEESQEFKWLDEDCHKELPFICQDLNEKASP